MFELAAIAEDNPGFDVRPFAVRQLAVRAGARKLVRTIPGGQALYDLGRDPDEANPLPGDATPDDRSLSSFLDHWQGSMPTFVARSSIAYPLDKGTRKALKALGYVR